VFAGSGVLGSNLAHKDDKMSAIKQSRPLIWSLLIILATAGYNLDLTVAGPLTLRFGHYANDDHSVGKTARQFVAILNETTGGRLRVDLYPGSKLGSAKSMFNATQEGSLDITLAPPIYLRDIAPKMDIVGLPFLFKNYEDVDRIFRPGEPVNEQLLEDLQRGNIKGLAFWEVGFRHISTSRRQIRTPWDLKGLRIRTISDQVLFQTFSLLGASPVSMPYGELFSALQRGAIDAQEGSIDTFYQSKLFETQRYLSLTRHSYTALVLVMNLSKFKSLSGRDQEFVVNAAQRAADWGRNYSRNLEEQNIRELEKMGLNIERNPDWYGFRKMVFYELQEKFVREDGRNLLREIERRLR
jgi:tripartite ATP-independent transporter DctP family solute receptor